MKNRINHISPLKVYELLDKNKFELLDVRTPQEFNEERIEGSINIDFYNNFEESIQKLSKDKEYIVYCRTGGRSFDATEIMTKIGYNVQNMDGGITIWKLHNLPTEK